MRETGRIHAGRVETSVRLQRVLEALIKAGDRGLTTRDIIEATGMCAINSIVAELRVAGYTITCDCEGDTLAGMRVYRYRLVDQGQRKLFS